ncbi:MAG TPA: PEP-CTERM sorting domain-containing protein [Bryobacteraceae bacterium]|nr:PEP-CTERM sorting domain-containing protein [Bryobacteraceae bacterium]
MFDEVGRNAGRFILVSLRGALLVAATAWAMQASEITWGSPTNETGNAGDVVTAGTFLESAFAGLVDVTLNGVVFAHSTNSSNPGTFADGSDITFDNVDGFNAAAGSAPGGWNSSYQTLTDTADYEGTGNMEIILGGLISGDQYEVQIFEPWWNNQFPTTYSDGTDVSGALNTGYSTTVPQYITGTFTADSTSETLFLGGTNTYALTSAVQVRDLTSGSISPVPEPSTVWILASGLVALAFARRFSVRRAA